MNLLRSSLVVMALVGGAAAVPAQNANVSISSMPSREASLRLLERLAAPRPAVDGGSTTRDPFYPSLSDLTGVVETPISVSDSLSDKERLELIAAQINPTGSVELGGEPYLLFTEKRQKIGDKLTVFIDKVEYVVEIASIDKNRYRIRYNNVETTRSIK